MRTEVRRRILIITVTVSVIAALVYGFIPKPVRVDMTQVKKGPMRVTIDEEGKTRVKDRFVVSAPVAGFLRRIELEVGDAIKKEQVLAALEPLRSSVLDPRSRAEALAAVSAAQAALNAVREEERSAEAAADYAKKNIERQKKLFESGYVAKDTLDQADADAKGTEAGRLSAEARVQAARADLERARSLLGHSAAEGIADRERIVLIKAPAAGGVLKIHHESEGVIAGGEPIIDIGDPGMIEVKAEVLSADAVKIKIGAAVLFERWGGSEPLSGVARIIEPAAFTKISSLGVEEQRVLVIADITSVPEDWKRLGDGYRVEASFVIWEGKDVLQVPSTALFRKGEGWAVFVVDRNRARLKEVKVGHRNGLVTEIVSGLTENELVITHPDDAVRDGVRVRLRNSER
ncbi:MAG: efflux RND transporter periplasmic adaptor subunit [Nitrospirae bacterium]|nr:efflux RND transporter periplasmic adaptor subunit [Nitrospirota bacterium]